MPRYICVFYTAESLAEISKKNKKVIVVDTDNPAVNLSVEGELKTNHGAKFISHIRNLNAINTYMKDSRLKSIEITNDYQFKEKELHEKDKNLDLKEGSGTK